MTTDNTQELDVNKLEQIIADHNKEIRTDMASEIIGGTRSKAITDVITVKAILGWHNKQVEAKLAHISECAENVISIDENGEFSMKAIPLSLVAVERNKLKADPRLHYHGQGWPAACTLDHKLKESKDE